MSPHIRRNPDLSSTDKGVHVKHTRSAVLATTSVLALALAACGGGESGGSGGGGGGGEFTPRGDVTMIVPFGAGGGSDLAGRATATMIEAANGDVNVNVENREGGSGAVGYSQLPRPGR